MWNYFYKKNCRESKFHANVLRTYFQLSFETQFLLIFFLSILSSSELSSKYEILGDLLPTPLKKNKTGSWSPTLVKFAQFFLRISHYKLHTLNVFWLEIFESRREIFVSQSFKIIMRSDGPNLCVCS